MSEELSQREMESALESNRAEINRLTLQLKSEGITPAATLAETAGDVVGSFESSEATLKALRDQVEGKGAETDTAPELPEGTVVVQNYTEAARAIKAGKTPILMTEAAPDAPVNLTELAKAEMAKRRKVGGVA